MSTPFFVDGDWKGVIPETQTVVQQFQLIKKHGVMQRTIQVGEIRYPLTTFDRGTLEIKEFDLPPTITEQLKSCRVTDYFDGKDWHSTKGDR